MSTRSLLALLALGTLAVPAPAQGRVSAQPAAFRPVHELRLPTVFRSLGPFASGRHLPASLGADRSFESDTRAPNAPLPREQVEVMAALIKPAGTPMMRDALEGASESSQRFAALPGGIVLGRTALLEGSLAGARLVLGIGGVIELRTVDGRGLDLPPAPAETLLACLDFARNPRGNDVAISMSGMNVHVAPELAGGEVGVILTRADRRPHQHLPGTRRTKSMILDRSVRLVEEAGRVVPTTDLEVRFYARTDSLLLRGVSRRVGTLVLADGPAGLRPDVTPPRTPEAPPRAASAAGEGLLRLAADLEQVGELATWIALFRREAAENPAGLDQIRAALTRP